MTTTTRAVARGAAAGIEFPSQVERRPALEAAVGTSGRASTRWVGAGLGALVVPIALWRGRPLPLRSPRATCLGIAGAYLLFVRPWHLRWGATDEEVEDRLPGDERVPHPDLQSTRAITIDTPPGAIWPWLAQMGWRRAGWYTYAFLDVFDLRARGEPLFSRRLTDRIIPDLQQPQVGDLVDPSGFRVAEVDPPRALVLEVRGGVPGIAWMAGDSTWTFALRPLDDHHTRLIERWRIAFPLNRRTVLFWGLVEAADFVMQRAQLRHIKERVVRARTTTLTATR